MDRGVPIEMFDVIYIGSVPVKRGAGDDIAREAVNRIVSLKSKIRIITLLVTTVGVYIIDKKTGDTLKEVNILDITFSAVNTENEKLVSFFESNRVLRLITCHSFKLNKNAFELCVAINDSFKILKGEVNISM